MHEICTIIASNYMPQALTLLDSLRKYHPDIPVTILITDIQNESWNLDAYTRICTPTDLGIDSTILGGMRAYYDQVELATSLKPFLLKHLIDSGSSTATFLDPDTEIYSPLEDIFEISRDYQAILTPHRVSPFSKTKDSFYGEETFLQYGTYNLGFISVSKHSMPLLDWWCQMLQFDSTRYPLSHVFTDQKWANQFPAYFNCYIYKGLELNIAPWNIDERDLDFRNEMLFAGNARVKLIHFSQMSSQLVRGESSDLWKATLSDGKRDGEVLEIISKLTREYQIRLRSKIGNYGSVILIPDKAQASSSIFARRYLRASLKQKFNAKFINLQIFKLLGEMKILEKSDTLFSIIV
jgi:hypothetical protein